MLPYWLLYFSVAGPAVLGRNSHATLLRLKGGALLLGIGLALFIGLRFEVGTDWPNYMIIFDHVRWLGLRDSLEISDPGFAALNWVVVQAGLDYWPVNLFCAAVFTAGLFKFVWRLPNPWLALAVATPYLIIVVAMGYTRQAVALGCLMWGLSGVSDKSFLRLMGWIVLAATFHRSAIIVLPVAGLAYTRNRIVVLGLTALTVALTYYLFLASTLESTLMTYNEDRLESQGATIRVIMNLTPAILFLLLSRKFLIGESERRLWRNFSAAALVCVPILFVIGSTTLIDRVALYIIPLQLFVFSNLPTLWSPVRAQSGPILFSILVYSASVQFVWLNYAAHAQDWLPYQLYPIFG